MEEKEKSLLQELSTELKRVDEGVFVHWNMNSADYGFEAIANRFRHLTGQKIPYLPSDEKRIDLDSLITDKFGEGYASHPKLPNLAVLNDCSTRFLRKGTLEIELANDGDFGSVQRSTTEKARIIGELGRRFSEGNLKTLDSVGSVKFAGSNLDAVKVVLEAGAKFRQVERSLKRRHGGRTTLQVADEYDAQDLYRSILYLFFHDVRDEPWTPDYAGSGSRIDFTLPDFQLAIELKKSRPSMTTKDLADELIVDSERYKKMDGITHLVCLVFDHEGIIPNPRGIEKDLRRDNSKEGLAVTVQIFDR
jgi:hypothetical protein